MKISTVIKEYNLDFKKVKLIRHPLNRPDAYKHFQFTILRVLPKIISPEEAINIENLYKDKFATRIFGMNKN
ncbi:GIY-YIG nuclease family protein [Anaeromicropila herbilytica]|uniref:Uncharacterized protein n=1 Tax=Anaeromicropila herbilytica TaxID=2785025 RepID=A0A7R7EN91_9FIRM|nr:hypothetical protein [Anaeromicropila herbilytica]BCN32080.1 hypothetical protein bsdtb5_33750 [Anaeromicropila herbilytica]